MADNHVDGGVGDTDPVPDVEGDNQRDTDGVRKAPCVGCARRRQKIKKVADATASKLMSLYRRKTL